MVILVKRESSLLYTIQSECLAESIAADMTPNAQVFSIPQEFDE
jgi:hypothetical protein